MEKKTTEKQEKWMLAAAVILILFVALAVYHFGFIAPQLDEKKAEVKTLTSKIGTLEGDKKALQAKLENPCVTIQDSLDEAKANFIEAVMKNEEAEIEISNLKGKLEKTEEYLAWYKVNYPIVQKEAENWKNKYEIIVLTQTETQIETQVQTRIITPQDNEGKLEVIPVPEKDLLILFLQLPRSGEILWDVKKSCACGLKLFDKHSPYAYIFNHNKKIKGVYNEIDNALVFNLKLSQFANRKFELNFFLDNERYWEMTQVGYSKYLYINADIGRYGYHFHIDQNGLVVSDGNQGG